MTDLPNIRAALPKDEDAICALLPQLADFNVPARRNPDDLWQGDAALVRQILAGEAADSFCQVATDEMDRILGVIVVTMREELMSHTPSAHLEAIVVAPAARGQRLGERLLAHCESETKARGAQSLSLHVFSNNQRARNLYVKSGFEEELIRATKWF